MGHPQIIRVCAVQAQLQFYQSADDFELHLDRLLQQAAVYQPDLVVLPEDIGTPLISLGDEDYLTVCNSLKEAISFMVMRHITSLTPIMQKWECSPQRALFLLKGDNMREIYVNTCSRLAKKYKITLAAGSIILPFEDATDSTVYNMMMLFGPDGVKLGQVEKVHPIIIEQEEGLDICAAPADRLQVFPTPAGRIGMLICADAWYPELAEILKTKGAQVIVNCLANPEEWSDQVAFNMTDSLPERVTEIALPGVQAFGVGNLFELPFRGRSKILMPLPHEGVKVVSQAESVDSEEIVFGEIEVK